MKRRVNETWLADESIDELDSPSGSSIRLVQELMVRRQLVRQRSI
jgi:hypothetical protein